MSVIERLKHELLAVGLYTAFFGLWFFALMLMKDLVLAEYQLRLPGVSAALVAALVLAKVVLVMERIPLGEWVRVRPAWIDVAARTFVYGLGVLAVLLAELAFEARHQAGGIVASLLGVLEHEDLPHVLVNTISTTGALMVFNSVSVVRRNLGQGAIWRMFRSPLPEARQSR